MPPAKWARPVAAPGGGMGRQQQAQRPLILPDMGPVMGPTGLTPAFVAGGRGMSALALHVSSTTALGRG